MCRARHDQSLARHRWVVAVIAAVGASTAVAACGSDGTSKLVDYCRSIERHLPELESPTIVTAADIDAQLSLYRSITAGAPLAVQPEWEAVVEELATAATVDPDDQASLQRAVDTARLSQSAAVRIQQYTRQSCGIDIDTPPPITNPVTATTQPPEDTDDG